MPPPTLFKLAKSACIANIRQIDDVGDAPYHVIRPVLLKLENPSQLRTIEKNSPQICGADAELWQNFIKKEIPNWRSRDYKPKDSKNWYKVYAKLQQEAEAEAREQAATLKAALSQKSAEKKIHETTFINGPIENGKRKRKHGIGGSRSRTPGGRTVMDKLREEAREASIFRTRNKIQAQQSRPTAPDRQQPAPRTTYTNKTAASVAPVKRPIRDEGTNMQPNRLHTQTNPTSRLNAASPETTASSPSKLPQSSPPRSILQKRPAPSIFMPNKRKRP